MNDFPSENWRTFQSIYLVDELLEALPALRSLEVWPSVSDWQEAADHLDIWSRLPQRLEFHLQKPLGQRAKRKQKNRMSYEVAITDYGQIWTRERNLHDFFNALIWLRYPQSKWMLHGRAYASQCLPRTEKGTRSELCDRLTCFDEGGVIFRLPPGLERAHVMGLIQSRDEDEKRRFCSAYRDRFHMFGHGILEVLFRGSETLFASCAVIEDRGSDLDGALAAYLSASEDQGGIDVCWLLEA